jgi:hypothetical protein
VIGELNTQIARLEELLGETVEQHPDAKLVRSLPGLGTILGARVLGEFGDDPNRYVDAKAARTTPAYPRSPKPPARAESCSPTMPATEDYLTSATCGPSRP